MTTDWRLGTSKLYVSESAESKEFAEEVKQAMEGGLTISARTDWKKDSNLFEVSEFVRDTFGPSCNKAEKDYFRRFIDLANRSPHYLLELLRLPGGDAR